MDIPDTKSRSQLKGYFVKNAIPTEGQFADLIEAGANQHDDGLVKTKGEPLSVEAGGDDTSQKRVLALFRSATDPDPACVVSLNPFGNPANANTRVAGLGIGDASGHTRLFLDPTSGRMGLGTVTPQATLQVIGGAIMPSAGSGENSGILFPRDPGGGGGDRAWLRYYPRSGERMTLELGTSNDPQDHIALMPSGCVGIGTKEPSEKLEVNGRIKASLLSLGTWPANSGYVFFGTNTLNQASAENYALLQDSSGSGAGRTFLNSPVDIRFRIKNVDKLTLGSDGNFGVSGDANVTGGLTASKGAKLNAIGIGAQPHGTVPYPYETIQLSSGHNLRICFGTKQRLLLQHNGQFTIYFDNGHWVFQNDGNLVKYNKNNKAIWALNKVNGHWSW